MFRNTRFDTDLDEVRDYFGEILFETQDKKGFCSSIVNIFKAETTVVWMKSKDKILDYAWMKEEYLDP